MKSQSILTSLITLAMLTTTAIHPMHHLPHILGKNLLLFRFAQAASLKKLPFCTQSKVTETQKALVTLGATSLAIAGGLFAAAQVDALYPEATKIPDAFFRLKNNQTLHISEIMREEATKKDIQIMCRTGFRFNPWEKDRTPSLATLRAQIITDGVPTTVGIAIYRENPFYSPPVISLDYLAIDPAYQRKGIGTTLINYIMEATGKDLRLISKDEANLFYRQIGGQELCRGTFLFINKKIEEEKRITRLTRCSAFQ